MRRGHPARARAVFAIEDLHLVPPDEIVLDTSFVVQVLVSTQPAHIACVQFLESIAEAGSLVVFNRLLELELAEAVFQLGLKELHPKDWKYHRHDGRSRRRASALLNQAQAGWSEVLSALRWSRVELDEVVDDVAPLMRRYGLASYDAVHAATAVFAGIRHFVTLDAGFANAPAAMFAIYTDRRRTIRCREIRSRGARTERT